MDGPSTSTATVEENDTTPLEKKNKPKDTKLRQQKLPAWQPILTASTVIPAIVVIGLVFLPIGVLLYVSSERTREMPIDYTDCWGNSEKGINVSCKDYMKGKKLRTDKHKCICKLPVILESKYEEDVYFYYGLENYYQNHRRYVKSRSDTQLLGNKLVAVEDCTPYQYENKRIPLVPCGAVANSMFNDTFRFRQIISANVYKNVPFTAKGVVWPVDLERKFKNPEGDGTLKKAFEDNAVLDGVKVEIHKPPNWDKNIWELGAADEEKDMETGQGFENVDFIVWMRTAALPTFRKLYRKLDRSDKSQFKDGLPPGSYEVEIDYKYLVDAFDGKKRFIISTTSWAGAKNNFLGIAYMAVGCTCLVLGLVFVVIHMKFGKSLTEISTVRTISS